MSKELKYKNLIRPFASRNEIKFYFKLNILQYKNIKLILI